MPEEEQCSSSKETLDGNGVVCRSSLGTKLKFLQTNEVIKGLEDRRKPPQYYGGEKGALLFIIFAPIFVMMINFMCTKDSCTVFKMPTIPTELSAYFNKFSFYIFVFCIGLSWLLHKIPLGPVVNGEALASGKTLTYRLNGMWIALLVILLSIILAILKVPLYIVHQNSTAFITLSIISSFLLSIYLYLRSFSAPRSELSKYGNTGNRIYDFFMGRELNPRIGDFDIKLFCLRFGMFSWAVYDLSLVASQTHQHGAATPSLLLSTLGHVLAMLDYFFFEETMLTSFTINHQGTGFLIVFGSFVFVPYVFSLNVRFILELNYKIESEPILIGIFFFICISHLFYRLANSDKLTFLRYPDNPEIAHYEFIEAEDGKVLLADGWWATVRHPNYLADILIAIGWCLTTGVLCLLEKISFAFLAWMRKYYTSECDFETMTGAFLSNGRMMICLKLESNASRGAMHHRVGSLSLLNNS